MRPRPSAITALLVLTIASCTADDSCTPTPAPPDCRDLVFKDVAYDEWREADPPRPRLIQELGNATYPACNDTDSCDGEDLDGFGSTDVWLVEGVDPADAVLGLREDTHTYVVFVAEGVDPESLEDRIDPRLLVRP